MPDRYIDKLKNLARGSHQYRSHRHDIFRYACSAVGAEKHLPDFLAKKLFCPDEDSWVALAFSDRDWKAVERLSRDRSAALGDRFCALAADCLKANEEHIRDCLEFDRRFSSALLNSGAESAAEHLRALKGVFGRSLFILRITAALNRRDREEMMEFFRKQGLSDWTRERFLYAFVYYYINLPADGQLDFHMSYVMPPGHDNDVEKSVIRFLLRDDIETSLNLSAKIYIGLLCHPYDLIEILVNHFEYAFAAGETLSDAESQLRNLLGDICPTWRMAPQIVDKDISSHDETPVLSVFEIYPEERQAVERLFDIEVFETRTLGDNHILSALYDTRARKYPQVDQYDTLVSVSRSYRGTVLGRMLGAWLTSTYLIPRRDQAYEIREVLRLSAFVGAVTPFVIASPNGRLAIEQQRLLRNGIAASRIIYGDSGVPKDASVEDRSWLKLVHWRLSALERDGRIREWFDAVRREIPLAPIYLTGIDWRWVDATLHRTRLSPFLGDASAAYALLLQVAEERGQELNRLRLILKPVAGRTASVAAFSDWLGREFGRSSLGFVRFFLSADMVLWLELSENFTSAQADRNNALERLVQTFRFDDAVMTELAFLQEQKAFTSALLMQNVGERQFGIYWDILKRDAAARQGDVFETYRTVGDSANSPSLMPASRLEAPYYFVNGQSATYQMPNRMWPLATVIFGIVDTFMEHPSQGIESILSVRIRHNNFKREIRVAVDELKRRHLHGPSISDRSYIIGKLEPFVLTQVQGWLDKRMHQKRPGKGEAIFDFVPSNDDLSELLDLATGLESFDAVADIVMDWLQSKLSTQLAEAQESLRSELGPDLCLAVDQAAESLSTDLGRIPRLADVVSLLKTTVLGRLVQLEQWFACPEPLDMTRASFADIASLIADRFEAETRDRKLKLGMFSPTTDPGVERHHVRLLFDLWSEMVGNSLKHSHLPTSTLRVSTFVRTEIQGLIFTAKTKERGTKEMVIDGHPFRSLSDALFREGNSGLRKVASLAASIADKPLSITAIHRRDRFHVIVPLTLATEQK